MKFLSTLVVIFYTLALSFLGGLIIWFVVHWVRLEEVESILELVYNDFNLRIVVGLSGALLILISFSLLQVFIGKIQREKTIAFSNPSGQVTVSLNAVEDFVRRLTSQIPEIKESRPNVVVNKKGIQIELSVILREAITIPEITLKLQEMVKDKVQEILGIEEAISVRIHVIKLASLDEKAKKRLPCKKNKEDDGEEENDDTAIPFQGYKST